MADSRTGSCVYRLDEPAAAGKYDFVFFIDVGGEDTDGKARITGPFDRISDKKDVDSISFRELEKNLVYFELEDLRLKETDEIGVRIKFKDEFAGEEEFLLGQQKQTGVELFRSGSICSRQRVED